MIIVDPVTLADSPCSRATAATYWDKTGMLRSAPANELRVTYQPNDLTKAPYALVEPAATNLLRMSESLNNALWVKTGVTIAVGAAVAPDGTLSADKLVESSVNNGHFLHQVRFASGETVTFSVFAKAAERSWVYLSLSNFLNASLGAHFNLETAKVVSVDAPNADYTSPVARIESVGNGWHRCILTVTKGMANTNNHAQVNVGRTSSETSADLNYAGDGTSGVYLWGAQCEEGRVATSYIKTLVDPVTRAADMLSAAAGLVYSSVAEPEPLYNMATSYALKAQVRVANHDLYESMIANNVGNDPTAAASVGKWLKVGKTNRWAQFDEQNNTQTSNADEIVFVLSPRAIAQGLFLGNLDATEVCVSTADPVRGLVYGEVQTQMVSSSKSSFFRSIFSRLRRRTYFLTLKLPVFAHGLVTVVIRRPGGIAKCGMAMIGPAIDIGLSHYGLSTEIKDFSSTTFNPDGTSSTIVRGYAKRMSVDVAVDNDLVDYVEEQLIAFRQKVVVYVGTVLFGSAMLVGKFSSFKKVIESKPKSKMALQIEGVV